MCQMEQDILGIVEVLEQDVERSLPSGRNLKSGGWYGSRDLGVIGTESCNITNLCRHGAHTIMLVQSHADN